MRILGHLRCQSLRQALALVVFVWASLGLADSAPFFQTHRSYHQVAAVNDGVVALEKRLTLIENAKSNIDVMLYLFGQDESGQLVMHALMKKAREGVHVRLLLDFFTGSGKPDIDDATIAAINEELSKTPIKGSFEIRYYNRGTLMGSLGRVNHRNHAKLMVVDRYDVLVGGRNVGDDYFSLVEGGFDYIDREIWARGPVGVQASQAFDAYWTNAKWVSKPEKPKIAITQDMRDFASLDLSQEEVDLRDQVRETAAHSPLVIRNVNSVAFAIDKPGHDKNDRIVTPVLNGIMASADRYLLIENYSLPMSDAKLRLLKSVATRKVPLVLLTNSFEAHDSPGVSAYSQMVERELLKLPNTWIYGFAGAPLPSSLRIDGRKPPKVFSTHTKALVSFSQAKSTAVVGSYNFDVRSEKTNNEAALIVEDAIFAADLATDIASRIQFAHPIVRGEKGQLVYADTQQTESRVFTDFKKVMQAIGLGKVLRSLY